VVVVPKLSPEAASPQSSLYNALQYAGLLKYVLASQLVHAVINAGSTFFAFSGVLNAFWSAANQSVCVESDNPHSLSAASSLVFAKKLV